MNKIIDNKEWQIEANMWFKFYTTFNDDNVRHADDAFHNNGLMNVTTEELFNNNVYWVNELMKHGLTKQEICDAMPEAIKYFNINIM